jgi:hypothetical protein
MRECETLCVRCVFHAYLQRAIPNGALIWTIGVRLLIKQIEKGSNTLRFGGPTFVRFDARASRRCNLCKGVIMISANTSKYMYHSIILTRVVLQTCCKLHEKTSIYRHPSTRPFSSLLHLLYRVVNVVRRVDCPRFLQSYTTCKPPECLNCSKVAPTLSLMIR